MYDRIVRSLVGQMGHLEILLALPTDFLHWSLTEQDAVWKAVLGRINDGTTDLQALVSFAQEWVKIFVGMRKVSGSSVGESNH